MPSTDRVHQRAVMTAVAIAQVNNTSAQTRKNTQICGRGEGPIVQLAYRVRDESQWRDGIQGALRRRCLAPLCST
jgi:hypothetical protein